MTLKEIQLDQRAEEYVRSVLQEGRGLSRMLLRAGFGPLAIRAVAPHSISPTALYSFTTGGVASLGDTHSLIAARIAGYLRRSDEHFAVFENQLADPGDAWLKRSKVRHLSYAGDVFHVLTSQDGDAGLVKAEIILASSHHFVGVLFDAANIEAIESFLRAEVGTDTPRARPMQLLVRAYDGESFLLADLHHAV